MLYSWFFPLVRARPPKAKIKSKDAEQTLLDLQEDYNPASKKKKIRTIYIEYNNPKTKVTLDIEVNAKLRADIDETETNLTGDPFIPPATVRRYANKEELVANNSK